MQIDTGGAGADALAPNKLSLMSEQVSKEAVGDRVAAIRKGLTLLADYL
jgi:hypothetical protein